MNIIPKPNGVTGSAEGFFSPAPAMTVNPGGFDKVCLAAFAERFGVSLSPVEGDAGLSLIRQPDFAPERYALSVTHNGVTIRAKTEEGVIWALTTLFLSRTERGFPCLTVDDEPQYSYRGFLLDCVRHFFSVDEVKRIIEQISLVKLNKLHWMLTNDQGWRIESLAYPALHEGIPYYKREEIREVVNYARERGVEIIPEIDVPGHSTSAIHVFPWLGCAGRQVKRAEGGGIYKTILCAGRESTYEFLFKILDETAELFPSKRIHIGGDEAPKSEWSECPHCKRRLAELGSESFEDLQGYFTGRVAEHLAKRGKEPVCWNETLRAEKLPEKLTVQYWMPGQDDEAVARFQESGGRVIFSDMFKLYFDYPHLMTPLKNVYDFIPEIGGTPCKTDKVFGLEACLWSERVDTDEKLETMVFPRVFALAEAAWTRAEGKDYSDFEKRLETKAVQLREAGMSQTPPEGYNPTEQERLAGLKMFAAALAQASEEPDDNKLSLAEIFNVEQLAQMLSGFGFDPSLLGALFG